MGEGVAVEILGQIFHVASDDGEDHVLRIAADVERRMRELAGRGQSAFTAAVIAALNIASEYQKLQDENQNVENDIDRLTARLVESLPAVKKSGKETG